MSWHVSEDVLPVSTTNLRSMGRQTQSWSQRLLKGGRFLPKITRTCPSVSFLPPSLPLSICCSSQSFPSPSPLYPFILSRSLSAVWKLFSSLKKKKKNWNQLCHRSSLLFWPVPGVKAPGIVSVGPVQEQCGAAMPGHWSHPSHIKCAHTHTYTHYKLFKRAWGSAKYWLGLCFISIR